MVEVNSLPAARVVGALACQQNSYLRTLKTQVVSCVKSPPPASNPKAAKGKAAAAKPSETSSSEETWMIECADSVLFPEGGGQPTDHGSLVITSGSAPDGIPIRRAERQGLRCILYSPAPLNPGEEVEQVIDHLRRWNHMQQHTGQHLLSAVMDKYDNLKTLGWGMGSDETMNYVDLPRKPTAEEMQSIQSRCNELIRDNLPITVETPEDAKQDKLPGDYDKSKGIIRVIRIGDMDSNTCCGTHLSQTSHISLIILGSTQSVHGKNCRLFFAAGDRAIALATSSIGAVGSLGKLMSCPSTAEDVVAKAEKMDEALNDLKRREKKLVAEIARFEADKVKATLAEGKNAWVYRPDGGLDFINAVTFEIKELLKTATGVVVLASGEEKSSGPVVILGPNEAVEAMATTAKDIVTGIKGGGKGGKWQAKVPEWKKEELEALRKAVEGV
ncbi:Threonyl/alanyl tRNA synthetase [Plectosphaerella plurivora]|uniref:Threonyl/alanyl tRNA synthetase n=1 Tax=Plectosphaerella plurivora TaxID=936078 RepID=A0A9P8V408_9PEZI|nr:Threonyl/alanyl tRNA synthetase [Plectosphaerella plurivora]